MMPPGAVFEALASARQVADYAQRLGIELRAPSARAAADHIGAVLADAILQAGINYRTVVMARVERIRRDFPEAAKLAGVKGIIDRGLAQNFLLWNHPTKVTRFVAITDFLRQEKIDDVGDLREWLVRRGARDRLLSVNGVGPKTYDYMCCLIGIDSIAVDRHVRTFASEAGVSAHEYDELRAIMSYAADLLGVSRRDFDAWIWGSIHAELKKRWSSTDYFDAR